MDLHGIGKSRLSGIGGIWREVVVVSQKSFSLSPSDRRSIA